MLTKTSLDSLKSEQEENFSREGKYKQKFPEIVDGVETWTDEYVGPFGKGYIIHEVKTEEGVKYGRATDYGPEKRSTDWVELKEIKE